MLKIKLLAYMIVCKINHVHKVTSFPIECNNLPRPWGMLSHMTPLTKSLTMLINQLWITKWNFVWNNETSQCLHIKFQTFLIRIMWPKLNIKKISLTLPINYFKVQSLGFVVKTKRGSSSLFFLCLRYF